VCSLESSLASSASVNDMISLGFREKKALALTGLELESTAFRISLPLLQWGRVCWRGWFKVGV